MCISSTIADPGNPDGKRGIGNMDGTHGVEREAATLLRGREQGITIQFRLCTPTHASGSAARLCREWKDRRLESKHVFFQQRSFPQRCSGTQHEAMSCYFKLDAFFGSQAVVSPRDTLPVGLFAINREWLKRGPFRVFGYTHQAFKVLFSSAPGLLRRGCIRRPPVASVRDWRLSSGSGESQGPRVTSIARHADTSLGSTKQRFQLGPCPTSRGKGRVFYRMRGRARIRGPMARHPRGLMSRIWRKTLCPRGESALYMARVLLKNAACFVSGVGCRRVGRCAVGLACCSLSFLFASPL
jgi:hypothetical protein